jgi:hypothetical protein
VNGVTDIFDAQAARDHLGVDGVTGVGVRGEHLAGDLCVSWFVRAYEAELVAAEYRDQAVQQKEAGNGEENDEFPQGFRVREPVA